MHPDAPETLDQNAHGAIGEFYHLGQACRAAHRMEIVWTGFDQVRIFLEHRHQQAVARHQIVHQLEAGARLHQQRHHGTRKNHYISQSQNRQGFRQ